MSRISFLNGEFLPHEKCLVHIEDRGFQFADAVYEVTLFENGKLIDGEAHLARLFRNLGELKIEHNLSADELTKMQLELFSQNKIESGTCYIQVSRGATNRVPYVPKNLPVTISATVSLRKKVSDEEFARGFSLMIHEDIRWKRCDIKTVGLLASSMINQKAKDSGFDDAIFVRDGVVTEGTFANAFIVDENDVIITKPADNLILCGITRNRLIELARQKNLKVVERNFSVAEMMQAKEVFLTSSSLIVRPISKIDGKIIADGKNRKIAKILNDAYNEFLAG